MIGIRQRLSDYRRLRARRRDHAVIGAVLMGHRHVVEIMRETGLGSGRVYDSLYRLERRLAVVAQRPDLGRMWISESAMRAGRPDLRTRWFVADMRLTTAVAPIVVEQPRSAK